MSSARGEPAPLPRTRRRLRAALFVGSLVVCDQLLLVSGLSRPAMSVAALIEPAPPPGPPSYRLAPDRAVVYASWGEGNESHVRVGPRGFREPEPAEPHDATVVFVGDSITFGLGVGDGETFPARVAAALAPRRVAVWNAGVPGFGLADFAGDAPRIAALHPQVVVLQLSRNDSLSPAPYGPVVRALAARSGFARLAWMLRFVFGSDVPRARAALGEALDAYARAGARIVVAHEGLPEGVDVAALLTERGLAASIELGGEAFEKLADDPHYSARGHEAVAARLLPAIRAALGN